MLKATPRTFLRLALFVILPTTLVTAAVAQTFTPGNIVVSVSGCGVTNATNQGTCSPSGGTGSSTGNGSGYGDDQGAPWTLWQYSVSGTSSATYVNSVQLPQNISGANYPVSNDYGSQSEGTVQLSGDGRYLTMIGLGLNSDVFNNNATVFCPPGYTDPPGYSFSTCDPENGNPALAQTGSLTGQTYSGNVPVPRVGVLIDANGNVNSSTVLYNIFNQNDPRSAYSANGSTIYLSGQGCKAWDPSDFLCDGGNYDNTSGVYYSNVGVNNYSGSNNPVSITGPDNGPSTTFTGTVTNSSKTVTGPAGSFSCTPSCASSPNIGASISDSIGDLGSTVTIASVQSTSSATMSANASGSSTSDTIVLGCTAATPCNSSSSPRTVQIYNGTLYVSQDDKPSGTGYNRSYIGTLGSPAATSLYSCGSTCASDDGPYGPSVIAGLGNSGGTGKATITTGANSNGNNLNAGLKINLSPSNFFFASSTVLYVADTGFPKNTSNGPDTICTTMGGKSKATVGDGGLQKWVNVSGTWTLEYTLYRGLNNGAGLVYNTDCNPNQPTTPGTTNAAPGLYGLTGVVNGSTVNLYATNYANDDLIQTYLYGISDTLSFTTATQAASESFTVLDSAPAGSLFRGVSFVPTFPNGNAEITSVASGLPSNPSGTTPAGLTITTTSCSSSPSTFITPLTLAIPSGCTLNAVTQAQSGQQYLFTGWQGYTAGASSYTVPAPSTTATYQANFTAQPQAIYSPAPSSTLPGASATFKWGGYPGATGFYLDVGTASHANLYYSSGGLSNTTFSQTVNTLPTDGSAVTVTWYYLLNGSYVANTYTYTAAGGSGGAATIASPAPSTALTGSSVTFTWNAATDNQQAYWLDVGTASHQNAYYSSGNLSTGTLSQTVSSLPTDGSTIVVTLYTETGGTYINNMYTYTAFNASASLAALSSPTPNNSVPPSLTSSSVPFSWTSVGAYAYFLDVGISGHLNYYYSQNEGTGTSATVNNLPTDGSPVVVTLYTQFSNGGSFYPNTYNFNAFNPSASLAVMQSPTNNSTFTGSSQTFTWSAPQGAYSFYLDVGTSSSINYYYSQSQGLGTSVTVNNLPTDGSPVVVTLYTQFSNGGSYYSNTYNYTAQ